MTDLIIYPTQHNEDLALSIVQSHTDSFEFVREERKICAPASPELIKEISDNDIAHGVFGTYSYRNKVGDSDE